MEGTDNKQVGQESPKRRVSNQHGCNRKGGTHSGRQGRTVETPDLDWMRMESTFCPSDAAGTFGQSSLGPYVLENQFCAQDAGDLIFPAQ